MRRTRHNGGFIICLIFNILLNAEWSIPAWILLGLHFWLRISLLWFFGALGLWLLFIFAFTLFISKVSGIESETPQRENKNPYSAKVRNPYEKQNGDTDAK